MQPVFIGGLLEALAGRFRVVLETNGTLAEAFRKVAARIDVVSMDIKLPSAYGGRALWKKHEEFLRAVDGRETVVKVVVSNATTASELDKAARLVGSISPDSVFVIQPMTGGRGVSELTGGKLLELYTAAKKRLKYVRVIPQTHKMLGVK